MNQNKTRPIALLAALLLSAFSFAASAEDISLCRQGWNATESGDHAGAIKLFESCIESGHLSNASLSRTYRNIGIANRRAKEPLKAVDAYNKALALQPDDPWSDYINRGNAYDEAGKFDEAMADYDTVLKLKPGYGEVFYNRGITYEHQNQLDKAKAEFIVAYDNGLRTKLLYERFVVYGLANPAK